MKQIEVNDITIGGDAPLFFIMGPCVIESEKAALSTLEDLLKITGALNVPFVFKSSYDKANRTSVKSFRGPGLKEGLRILKKAKDVFKVSVLTDVHCTHDVGAVAEVCDVLQIPAYLCRQTDLIVSAAKTGAVVNIKKGQFLSPQDMRHSVGKALSTGNEKVFVTERGTSFGYNNLVVDFRGLPIMRSSEWGAPVVFDATHSVQSPGGGGECSGGDRDMARHLASAAVAVGVDGIFMEVHQEPDKALCDGPNSVAIKDLPDILARLIAIDRLVKAERT